MTPSDSETPVTWVRVAAVGALSQYSGSISGITFSPLILAGATWKLWGFAYPCPVVGSRCLLGCFKCQCYYSEARPEYW